METQLLDQEFQEVLRQVLGHLREIRDAGTCGKFALSVSYDGAGELTWRLTEELDKATPPSIWMESTDLKDIAVWLKRFCSF